MRRIMVVLIVGLACLVLALPASAGRAPVATKARLYYRSAEFHGVMLDLVPGERVAAVRIARPLDSGLLNVTPVGRWELPFLFRFRRLKEDGFECGDHRCVWKTVDEQVLMVRLDGEVACARSTRGSGQVDVCFEDYRTVEGWQVPGVITARTGELSMRLTLAELPSAMWSSTGDRHADRRVELGDLFRAHPGVPLVGPESSVLREVIDSVAWYGLARLGIELVEPVTVVGPSAERRVGSEVVATVDRDTATIAVHQPRHMNAAILAHELVHVRRYRRGHDQIFAKTPLAEDIDRMRMEGEASLAELGVRAVHHGLDFSRLSASEVRDLYFRWPEALVSSRESGDAKDPYLMGLTYWIPTFRAGGWAAIDRDFLKRPPSDEWFLHPHTSHRDWPTKIPPLTLEAAAGSAGQAQGELFWYRYFRELASDQRQALVLAAGWDGSATYLIPGPTEDEDQLFVRTVWDRAVDATEVVDFLRSAASDHSCVRASGRVVDIVFGDVARCDALLKQAAAQPFTPEPDPAGMLAAERTATQLGRPMVREVEGRWHHSGALVSVELPDGWRFSERPCPTCVIVAPLLTPGVEVADDIGAYLPGYMEGLLQSTSIDGKPALVGRGARGAEQVFVEVRPGITTAVVGPPGRPIDLMGRVFVLDP